ncbi:MAG: ketopantoate reductase family protein [Spirochaetaceae bacterium]|nr:ketopantoate reductase family protein [Spirochaetaceae bacterium]
MKKICVIGFGAVGALYGDKLNDYLGTANVEILAKGNRLERYKKNGISINGETKFYNVVDPKDASEADFILLATKNLQIDEAVIDIKNAVGENTIILSLLNGIESEEKLIKAYGEDKVLYGFCVGLSSENSGSLINFTSIGKIVFGEKDNRESESVKALKSLFDKADVPYLVPQDIRHDQYNKFMLNTVFNTLSAICRGGYGIFSSPSLADLGRKIAFEVIEVSKKEGVILTSNDFEEDLKLMGNLPLYGRTSMCQDIMASKKTENNWFSGTIIRLGEKHNIPTPYNRSIYLIAEGCEFRNEMNKNRDI